MKVYKNILKLAKKLVSVLEKKAGWIKTTGVSFDIAYSEKISQQVNLLKQSESDRRMAPHVMYAIGYSEDGSPAPFEVWRIENGYITHNVPWNDARMSAFVKITEENMTPIKPVRFDEELWKIRDRIIDTRTVPQPKERN